MGTLFNVKIFNTRYSYGDFTTSSIINNNVVTNCGFNNNKEAMPSNEGILAHWYDLFDSLVNL